MYKLTPLIFAVLSSCTDVYASCTVFPVNNVWNTRIDSLPVHANSAQYVANIGGGTPLHTDFGHEPTNGIPYSTLTGQYFSSFFTFGNQTESDQVKYPVNPDTKLEAGDDHHLITIDKDTCKLYEIYHADPTNLGGDSGAVFDLNTNSMRPMGFTSADAAGLPIFAGLVRYSEIQAGAINHAIRFTAEKTHGNTWPGTHVTRGQIGNIYTDQPPLGARYRLKADYDISTFHPTVQIILTAMKKYGMILADNGGNWYISGTPDARWDDDVLSAIGKVRGNAFEVVDESCMMVKPDSYQADLSQCHKPLIIAKSSVAANSFIDDLMAVLTKWGKI